MPFAYQKFLGHSIRLTARLLAGLAWLALVSWLICHPSYPVNSCEHANTLS